MVNVLISSCFRGIISNAGCTYNSAWIGLSHILNAKDSYTNSKCPQCNQSRSISWSLNDIYLLSMIKIVVCGECYNLHRFVVVILSSTSLFCV